MGVAPQGRKAQFASHRGTRGSLSPVWPAGLAPGRVLDV